MKARIRRLACAASLCAALLCVAAPLPAQAQKRPKPALSAKDARRAIASARGFGLQTGAVKVKDVSPAGREPVVVTAEVTEAFRLAWVEDERAPQTGGVFRLKRWRAVEFRTGDRAWEEFDIFAAAAGESRVEAARRALEELVTEFAALQAEAGGAGGGPAGGEAGAVGAVEGEGGKEEKEAKREKDAKKEEGGAKPAEPLTRGPLTIKQLSPMGSTAVVEVVVEAAFTLSKDARGRWQVSAVSVGGETVADLESLWQTVNTLKAERARADLSALAGALEAFRRERGFYVVARDSVALLDHLAPRYSKRVIRLDPWRNPYRYEGTAARYTLGSDGPDGKPGTADDVTLTR